MATPILAGPPAAVSGFIPFENTTGNDVVITQVEMTDSSNNKELIPVDSVAVPAGKTARIALNLTFQPQTTPDEYQLVATIGGATITVLAQVAESRQLAMSPDALVVDNVSNATVVKPLVVSNEGNVPVYVADFGAVPLYREDAALTTMLAMARPRPDAAAPAIEPLPEKAATLTVSTGSGRIEIPPGEGRKIDLTITVPADLPQTSRYLAALPVSVRTLLVAVVPAGAGGSP